MKINMHHTFSAFQSLERAKAKLYFNNLRCAHKTPLVRLGAPAVAVGSALLTIIFRVAAVGETTLKGVGNVFGAPFFNRCNFLRGVRQLYIDLPIKLYFVALTALEIPIGALVTTVALVILPRQYSEHRFHFHADEFDKLKRFDQPAWFEEQEITPPPRYNGGQGDNYPPRNEEEQEDPPQNNPYGNGTNYNY